MPFYVPFAANAPVPQPTWFDRAVDIATLLTAIAAIAAVAMAYFSIKRQVESAHETAMAQIRGANRSNWVERLGERLARLCLLQSDSARMGPALLGSSPEARALRNELYEVDCRIEMMLDHDDSVHSQLSSSLHAGSTVLHAVVRKTATVDDLHKLQARMREVGRKIMAAEREKIDKGE